MSVNVERIKEMIRCLPSVQRDQLLRDLQNEHVFPSPDFDDEVSVEAEWNSEINRRADDIRAGTAQLIPHAEVEKQVDAMLAELRAKQ